jgi:NAD(P)H-flavin reductase
MLKLVANKKLTHDVYELTFSSDIPLDILPGHFLLLTLPSGLRRAYSVANCIDGNIIFIVKSLESGAG